MRTDYGSAIRLASEFCLGSIDECFFIGQGLWSPWYVGNTMTDLDKKFGASRVIDTPVSESAVTGLAVGAAVCGRRPVVVHPRMDFMLYAFDSIVNQAAKWRHMTAGKSFCPMTVRSIINRGGEQGAQHSQALQAMLAHVPGLRVVMPSTVQDAYSLFIASVQSDDPVIFIDDRWLYDLESDLRLDERPELSDISPVVINEGTDLTVVGSGYSTHLGRLALIESEKIGVQVELIDLRQISPLDTDPICLSVEKTGRLLVLDGGTSSFGVAAEVISRVAERLGPAKFLCSPRRLALPDCPAPCSKSLETQYYPSVEGILTMITEMVSLQ